ncbi:hypothetical protein VAR608DRAFT_1541 [Variovorax sp. HW608]|nr:hypothetical protein VAR608DRAFT_1541 [Variovorax sp. HW608]
MSPSLVPLANETSFGGGYAPLSLLSLLSPLENAVLAPGHAQTMRVIDRCYA